MFQFDDVTMNSHNGDKPHSTGRNSIGRKLFETMFNSNRLFEICKAFMRNTSWSLKHYPKMIQLYSIIILIQFGILPMWLDAASVVQNLLQRVPVLYDCPFQINSGNSRILLLFHFQNSYSRLENQCCCPYVSVSILTILTHFPLISPSMKMMILIRVTCVCIQGYRDGIISLQSPVVSIWRKYHEDSAIQHTKRIDQPPLSHTHEWIVRAIGNVHFIFKTRYLSQESQATILKWAFNDYEYTTQ